ncbi:MAG: hypothetical protein U5N55_07960 [Cypionkella sp.]|nr:hypothetical protein [Cypionkella sp.]
MNGRPDAPRYCYRPDLHGLGDTYMPQQLATSLRADDDFDL